MTAKIPGNLNPTKFQRCTANEDAEDPTYFAFKPLFQNVESPTLNFVLWVQTC